jgi:eukaryotic-like serine/threonine-protein kinase
MTYPTSEDYMRAVQQPERAFRLPALREAKFELHPRFRIPMPASGNAAVVFKAAVDGADQALRFFIREDVSTSDRYAALGYHFSVRGLNDCVARATWTDDAITVKQATWPVVQMQWVDGRTLDAYVGHLANANDVLALHNLATRWRTVVDRLQRAEFAHGDLQHGNVLIDTRSTLRLVDFDGSWIEAFSGGPPPSETGHPNYQRTGREWGRWMDTFPGLVIYTSLLALSRRPDLWGSLHDGENLLFSHPDFVPPFTTMTWLAISEIRDPDVEDAVARLKACCTPQWQAADTLESLLRPAVSGAGSPVQPVPAAVPDRSAPWWVQTAAPSADAVRSGGAPVGLAALPPPPPKTSQLSASLEGPRFRGAGSGSGWYASPSPPWPVHATPPPPLAESRAPSVAISLAIGFVVTVVAPLLVADLSRVGAILVGIFAGALALPLLLRARTKQTP